MLKRQALLDGSREPCLMFTPFRTVFLYRCPEPSGVVRLYQMDKFVDDNVINYGLRCLIHEALLALDDLSILYYT